MQVATCTAATHSQPSNTRLQQKQTRLGKARRGEGWRQAARLAALARPARRAPFGKQSAALGSASARQLVCGRHGNKSVGKHTDGKLLLARCHNIVF